MNTETSSTVEQDFLKDLKGSEQPLGETLNTNQTVSEKTNNPDADPTKAPEEVKNRRHKRLERMLEDSGKMNSALNEKVIELAAKVNTLTGLREAANTSEFAPELVQLFGTTDEGKAATKVMTDLLSKSRKEAEESAVQRMQRMRDEERQEEVKQSKVIDDELSSIEDKFGIDFESDKKSKTEFLNLLESLSPKDDAGNIKDYADFETTFELYQKMSPKGKSPETAKKQKELASRTMTQGGQVNLDKMPEGRMTFNRARQEIDRMRQS